MGQNKAQREAEDRAKKSTALPTPEVQPAAVAEQPKPTPAPAATAQPATAAPAKQATEIARFQEALKAQGTDLSQMKVIPDGKFTLVVVGPGWPTAAFGPTGGLTIRELKSYAKAWDAGLNGKELFEKQQAREQKKAAAAAPAPPAAKAPAAVTA